MARLARILAPALALALLGGLGSGCAALGNLDWGGHRKNLQDTQLKFVHFLRWGEYGAASMMVDEDLREDFLKEVQKLAEVRLSDYEVLDTQFNEDRTEATVLVAFSAYHLRRLEEHRWTETHVWTRKPGEKTWTVRPDIEKIRVALAELTPR